MRILTVAILTFAIATLGLRAQAIPATDSPSGFDAMIDKAVARETRF